MTIAHPLSSVLSNDEFIERRIEYAKSETLVSLSLSGTVKLDRLIEDERFNEIFQFKKGDIVEVVSPISVSLVETVKEGTIVTILHRTISYNNKRLYSVRLADGRHTAHNEENHFAFPLKIQEISTDEIINILEG